MRAHRHAVEQSVRLDRGLGSWAGVSRQHQTVAPAPLRRLALRVEPELFREHPHQQMVCLGSNLIFRRNFAAAPYL